MDNNLTIENFCVWEEKNLIEPEKKLESNGNNNQNDTMTNTNQKSAKNECENIIIKSQWNKKCPKCGKDQYYKYKRHFEIATTLNKTCISCGQRERFNKPSTKTKICNCCKKEKPIEMFSSYYHKKFSFKKIKNICKECSNIKQKKYRIDNLERMLKLERKYYHRDKTNPMKAIKEKERRSNYQKRKRKDLNWKIKTNLSRRINNVLYSSNTKKYRKTVDMLGCDILAFKNYLEKLFQPGMNWDNYGCGIGKWQIDHIIPCEAFNLTKIEEQLVCFNYKNLRPLWASENASKCDKLPDGKRARYIIK